MSTIRRAHSRRAPHHKTGTHSDILHQQANQDSPASTKVKYTFGAWNRIHHPTHIAPPEKALIKRMLQKTGFKLSSSSLNFKVRDDFARHVQKKYRDRYMVPAQYLEHCKTCMCARIRGARGDSVQ